MLNLNNGIAYSNYYYSPFNHLILNDDNIGTDGVELTISFLSLNRVDLSIRLLQSIKKHISNFKGEVLIIDNGSDIQVVERLKRECKHMPFKCRFIELKNNYGVSVGRNKTMAHVYSKWVMFLDNDIYFINNPLSQLQQDISLLGCHFLNLPLLENNLTKVFAFGGHLSVFELNHQVQVEGTSCMKPIKAHTILKENMKPFISNFLFGGASIVKKETFLANGGFDETFFIGLEDVDFSIKLLKQGYKIGNTTILSLVHDHPKPVNNLDMAYEKQRYSTEIIKKSAIYFEKKHGLKVWSPRLAQWLKQKNRFIQNPQE